jgi:hypothetical protein
MFFTGSFRQGLLRAVDHHLVLGYDGCHFDQKLRHLAPGRLGHRNSSLGACGMPSINLFMIVFQVENPPKTIKHDILGIFHDLSISFSRTHLAS